MKATGAPLAIHPLDIPLLREGGGAKSFGIQVPPAPEPDIELAEGDTLSFGTHTFEVLFTPGHTRGHVSFYEPKVGIIFDGDVLFAGSIGRTDLPGGDHETLMNSITEKLLVLPDEGQVNVTAEDWGRLGAAVDFARIDCPGVNWTYHQRLPATIALAETSRQVGMRVRPPGRKPAEELGYDRVLETVTGEVGEEVFLDDLQGY